MHKFFLCLLILNFSLAHRFLSPAQIALKCITYAEIEFLKLNNTKFASNCMISYRLAKSLAFAGDSGFFLQYFNLRISGHYLRLFPVFYTGCLFSIINYLERASTENSASETNSVLVEERCSEITMLACTQLM